MDCYVPDEDFVFYESKQDMISKIEYYLKHEDERVAIARNGYERTVANHTYNVNFLVFTPETISLLQKC